MYVFWHPKQIHEKLRRIESLSDHYSTFQRSSTSTDVTALIRM
jgi:hypothetical protein